MTIFVLEVVDDGGYGSRIDEDLVIEVEASLLKILVGSGSICKHCLCAVGTCHVYGDAVGLVIIRKYHYELASIGRNIRRPEEVLAFIKG